MKLLIIYIPVLHQGYVDLVNRQRPDAIRLLSSKNVEQIDSAIAGRFSREIRARPVQKIAKEIHSEFPEIDVQEFDGIDSLKKFSAIVMPNEDVSHLLEKMFSKEIKIIFDDVFLRWDWSQTNTPKSIDGHFSISSKEEDRLFMAHAVLQASGSSDVWRQVGAVIPYEEGKMITAFNKHLPTNTSHYIVGDPRLNMKPGESPDICSAIHAEALAISTAAKMKEVSLEGGSIYVTTFPCPVCARMIVESGIKKVFFKEGYSVLDAADILLYAGVEVFQVK